MPAPCVSSGEREERRRHVFRELTSDGRAGHRELAAVKQANAKLRTELTTSLLRLQQLGGSDPKAAELISDAFRSLESLREDIAWPVVRHGP